MEIGVRFRALKGKDRLNNSLISRHPAKTLQKLCFKNKNETLE